MVEVMQREYGFSQVFNFRDLGGYQTADGRRVRWRRLFRSDDLSRLVSVDQEKFLSLGVRTVLDLRRAYEIAELGRAPEWDGVAYHNIDPDHREWGETPYAGGEPARYLADRYLDLAEQGAPRLAAAIGLIADREAAPVVVHCVAGKDRTGVVCALTLSLLGVPDLDVAADYALSTTGGERWVAWARANGLVDFQVPSPLHPSPPEAMRLFLAGLRQRYGSVERYLTEAGLAPEHVGALRTHLLSE
jgi:protein-tyrosine phosphatase